MLMCKPAPQLEPVSQQLEAAPHPPRPIIRDSKPLPKASQQVTPDIKSIIATIFVFIETRLLDFEYVCFTV
jgi:hypothetical protein